MFNSIRKAPHKILTIIQLLVQAVVMGETVTPRLLEAHEAYDQAMLLHEEKAVFWNNKECQPSNAIIYLPFRVEVHFVFSSILMHFDKHKMALTMA